MLLVPAQSTTTVQGASISGKCEQSIAPHFVTAQELPSRIACRWAMRWGRFKTTTALGESLGKQFSDGGSTPPTSTTTILHKTLLLCRRFRRYGLVCVKTEEAAYSFVNTCFFCKYIRLIKIWCLTMAFIDLLVFSWYNYYAIVLLTILIKIIRGFLYGTWWNLHIRIL